MIERLLDTRAVGEKTIGAEVDAGVTSSPSEPHGSRQRMPSPSHTSPHRQDGNRLELGRAPDVLPAARLDTTHAQSLICIKIHPTMTPTGERSSSAKVVAVEVEDPRARRRRFERSVVEQQAGNAAALGD